jgi:hypothetical protein
MYNLTCERPIILSGEPKSTQHIYRSTCRGGFSNTYMTPEGKAITPHNDMAGYLVWFTPNIANPN